MSPPGGSILTTVAPRSARIWLQYGPARFCVRSQTRTSDRGAVKRATSWAKEIRRHPVARPSGGQPSRRAQAEPTGGDACTAGLPWCGPETRLRRRDDETKTDERSARAGIGPTPYRRPHVPWDLVVGAASHHPERLDVETLGVVRLVVRVGLIGAPRPLPDVAAHVRETIRAFGTGE